MFAEAECATRSNEQSAQGAGLTAETAIGWLTVHLPWAAASGTTVSHGPPLLRSLSPCLHALVSAMLSPKPRMVPR